MEKQPMQVTLHDIVNCLTGAKAFAAVMSEQLLATDPDKARLVKSLGEDVASVWTKYAPLLLPRADKS
jgi:hypothetical protein